MSHVSHYRFARQFIKGKGPYPMGLCPGTKVSTLFAMFVMGTRVVSASQSILAEPCLYTERHSIVTVRD